MNLKTLLFLAVVVVGAWWHFKGGGGASGPIQVELPDGMGGVTIDTTGMSAEQRKSIEAALRDAKSPEEIQAKLAGIAAQMESASAAAAPGLPPARKFDLEDFNERYQTVSLQGWQVRVARELVTRENAMAQSALTVIDAQLASIARVLPAERVAALRQVTIWVELKVPGMEVLVYHPDASWLTARGLNPEKANGIDIPDVAPFLMNAGQQPGMLLHELTHAYHLRALGEKNEDILRTYQNAKAAGLYAQVKSVDGSVGAAYALTNEKEYFAEITEAYFLKNDFFPFTREELRTYDPGGYALVEALWLRR